MENNQININEQSQEQNPIDKISARSAYRRVIFSYITYFLLSNITAYALRSIKDQGILMIGVVLMAIIPIYFFIGKDAMKQKEKVNEIKLSIMDYIFFIGIMYTSSLIFGAITNKLVEVFNIPSPNVTLSIQQNMNLTLFIYVVLIGPFIEELQFRGFYLNHTRDYGKHASILLVSLVFAFSHLNIIQGFGTIGLGMVLTYISYFYSFKSAVILHIANNLLVSIIGFISENEMMLQVFSLIILGLMIFSISRLFTKKRKDNLNKNLGLDSREKEYLKILLTDPIFLIYVLLIIALSIYMGYVSTQIA